MSTVEDIKRRYLADEITPWLACAELLQVSIGVLTAPEHDRSQLGRLVWALRQMDLFERERRLSAKSQE